MGDAVDYQESNISLTATLAARRTDWDGEGGKCYAHVLLLPHH